MRTILTSLFLFSPLFGVQVDLESITVQSEKEVAKKLSSELALESEGETLGDFLQNETFIDSATYGSAVGRPVVKGLDGYRVGITQGNVVLNDLSAMSQDHAVGTAPRVSERIEFVKGSSSLLYGNYSGGVVRVEGAEHQRETFQGFQGNSEISNFGWLLGGSLGVSKNDFSLQADTYFHEADDDISDITTFQNHFVFGYRFGDSILKLYGDFLRNDYSIPNRSAEETRIDMEQEKFGAVWHFGKHQFEIQKSDYLHYETEGGRKDGLFGQEQSSVSALLNFTSGDWEHKVHLQYLQSELQVCHEHGKCDSFYDAPRTEVVDGISLGSEIPFSHGHPMPNSSERNLVLAFSPKLTLLDDEVGFGVRIQNREIDLDSKNIQEQWLQNRDYYNSISDTAFSFSTDWKRYFGLHFFQLSLGYLERLPASSELYWNGFHHATESYILGDAELDSETSLNFDADLHLHFGNWETEIAGYHYHFWHYIYQSPLQDTKDPFHGSPVWIMRGVLADIYGFSFQEKYRKEIEKHKLQISFGLETIRGETSDGNLPRISPWNAFVKIEDKYGDFQGSLKYKYIDKSRFEAENESSTSGYSWLSGRLSYKNFYLKGENLLDVEARNHLSFLKETAQLPGREISFGFETSF
jgi:iron complex outermembrane receptor protein